MKKESNQESRDLKKRILNKEMLGTVAFGVSMSFFIVFVPLIVFILYKLDYSSGNIFVEIMKMSQLILFIYFVVYFSKKINGLLAVFLGAFFCWTQLILTFYFSFAKKRLDFSFFARNRENIIDVAAPYGGRLFFAFIFSLVVGYFFYKTEVQFRVKKKIAAVLFFLLLVVPLLFGEKFLNEIFFFAKSAYTKDRVIERYEEKYEELVQQSIENKKNVLSKEVDLKEKEVPSYLDNIIFLQLESLNGKLVDKENSPNLYKIAQQGILFDDFYGNSVQTILGQENILCSLPSSFKEDLVSSGQDKDILCLPGLLQTMGYETAFFKTYSLAFEDTGEFMSNIGFEHLHDYDIMSENDPWYDWGFREDVFYERTFSHIRENFSDKRNLFFVEVGPTNHWPFETPKEYVGQVPFAEPKNHREKLVNTLHIQDRHLAVAWEEIQKTFPKKNYTVVVLGDHSWPHGEHEGNEFCISGSYEENFRTSMTIVFGDGDEMVGRENSVAQGPHSQMDIFPTFARLLGVEFSNNVFQRDLFDSSGEDKRIILVQPFLDKTLNVVKGKNKFQYKTKEKELTYFNLENDPLEEMEISVSKGDKDTVRELEKLLNSSR